MVSWVEFAAAEPSLASDVRALMCQYGAGLGYLATVRPDGGPRLHPVAPVISDEGLFCFVIRSPKQHDLDRDGRYALHAFPPEESDDEAYLSGRARPVTDAGRRERLSRLTHADPTVDWKLYELTVEVAMVVRRRLSSARSASAASRKVVWRDPAGEGPLATVRPLRQWQRSGPCAAAADSVQ
jgi:Pyridoxamine 5'-phosphate oxidase